MPLEGDSKLPSLILAAYGGCALTRMAAFEAFCTHKRAMVAHDLLSFIGPQFFKHFETSDI